MDGIEFIVRGDHFGLSHAANQAIEEAFETGLLTCASLAVVSPWAAEAAVLAGQHPAWEIGVQLELRSPAAGCRWGPVAGRTAVPSLVTAMGHFHQGLPATALVGEIVRELEAQVERALAWGIEPAYLTYPDPPHPAVEDVLARLSERLGVPAQVSTLGIHHLGVGDSGGPFSKADFLETLRHLTPATYLWIAHPAFDSPETWALWGEETAHIYHGEALALCDPEVLGAIRERGIKLTTITEFRARSMGQPGASTPPADGATGE